MGGRGSIQLGLCLAAAWSVGCTGSGLPHGAAGASEAAPVLHVHRGVEGAVGSLRYAGIRTDAELVLGTGAPGSGAEADIEVRLQGDERLFGMRRFRLREVNAAREESVLLSALRQGHILTPRHIEVRVSIDAGDASPRVVEDDFSKELLEAQERRDGVMFRFDAGTFPEIRVEAFGRKKIRKSERRAAQLATAEGLLTGFLRGKLAAREAFDLELLARFLALAEVWNSASLLAVPNLRFYFNPVTQRIEPIGYRARPGPLATDGPLVTRSSPWASRLLEDAELRALVAQQLDAIAREVPAGDGASVAAGERARGLTASGASLSGDSGISIRRPPEAPALDSNPIPSPSLEQVLADHPFLEWIGSRSVLRGASGEWPVRGSLVLPEGIGLELIAGTTLHFEPGAVLLATGPLHFVGTAQAPVVLDADAGRSRLGGSWQGIVVLRSARGHVWEHVVVRDATGVDRDGWTLTGGVTFRASEVRISESQIAASPAEDALNLIRSRFAFSDLSIRDAASDAFDADFCTGTIRGGTFEVVGGDGIDVSGSAIGIEGVSLVGIRDKALSVGEKSQVTARDLQIRDVGTAFASKDGSELDVADSALTDVHYVGLMAYTKKAEYGPARLAASRIQLVRVARGALVQHGSRLQIDGREIEPETLDVDQLYEVGPMKK